MGNTIQIDIPVNSTEHSEIVVAEFSEMNFHCFEQKEAILSLFIKEEYFGEKEFETIINKLRTYYTKIIIPDINWNQKWESEFRPVIVNSFVTVRASFHSLINKVEHEIIITPKMSFGTGHHATTYLMLQQMEHIDFTNKKVLDFGTGTGILSILANKLFAKEIIAIDNDDWSIVNAKENLSTNNCDKVMLLRKDSITDLGTFDIILANINLNTITSNIKNIKAASHSSTKLLVSGILSKDEVVIRNVFSENGFCLTSVIEKDGWLCTYFETEL